MSTLPEKWYIVATEDNYDELEAWRQTVATSYLNSFQINHPLLSEHPGDTSYYYGGWVDALRRDSDYDCYKEITIEQFRQITKPMGTLPTKWYIGVTEENQEELNRWRKKVATSHRDYDLPANNSTLLSMHPIDGSYYYHNSVEEIRNDETYEDYQEITLEQFRQITNATSNQKPMVKSIKISRNLLNEYYEAATGPQKEYLTEHFKLDGTTTEEAIRGLHEMACNTWKPRIKKNHPECFPEDSKYFDFSKHANQYGCSSIVSDNVAHSLGLCKDFIQVRNSITKNSNRSFYLHGNYDWVLVQEESSTVLIPMKK